jgi:hypothetical protein
MVRGSDYQMPVVRYFVFVGGALLALLLAISAFATQPVAVAESSSPAVDKTVVRIRSDQQLPERVVYDTSLPTIVPSTTNIQVAAAPPPPAVDTSAQDRVRDTFAQIVPAEPRKLEPQRKRKVAKVRSNTPVRVAQQSPFGFFGSPSWNSNW